MTRLLLGLVGVVTLGYGGWLLADDSLADLRNLALWLVVGVVVHDFVLAPLVLLGGGLVGRLLPSVASGPVAAGLVVLGTVTVMAVPVLGSFGAIEANPSLLDRSYWAGWWVLAGLVALGIGLGTAGRIVATRRRHAAPRA